MAYIRKKTYQSKRGQSTYYYVVETHRENGKVKQRVITYLSDCPTIEEAIRRTTRYLENATSDLDRARAALNRGLWSEHGREKQQGKINRHRRKVDRLAARLAELQALIV